MSHLTLEKCSAQRIVNVTKPPNIMEILNNYFLNYSEGEQEYVMKADFPLCSVRGPLLWNIRYDEILRLLLPNGATIVGFADNIAIVSIARTVRETEEKINTAIGWGRFNACYT